MPKWRIHEFYGFTKTFHVEADSYDDAWDAHEREQTTLVYDGSTEPELETQECEDVTDYA